MSHINGDWVQGMFGDGGARDKARELRSTGGSKPESKPDPIQTENVGDRSGARPANAGAPAGGSSTAPASANPSRTSGRTDQPKQEGQEQEVNKEALRAEIVQTEIEDISFDDIKGQDKAVAEIRQIADKLQYSEIFKIRGAIMPRGILLTGPPGTGKTMLATAFANSAQAAFLSVSCADVMSKFVGIGEKTVEAIFDIAEEEAAKHPNGHAILFLDEIDALIRSRDLDSHESSDKILSIFLTRINGLAKAGNVTVVGATNRPDKLDAAFISRMNEIIEVNLPDAEGRAAILEARMRKTEKRANQDYPGSTIKFVGDIDFAGIAQLMAGEDGEAVISGRELDHLANELSEQQSLEILKQYQQFEGTLEESQRKDPNTGKRIINRDKVCEIASSLPVMDTEYVLSVAKTFSKTRFMFDVDVSVSEYMQRIQSWRESTQAANPSVADTPAKTESNVTYALTPMDKAEARHDLIDVLKGRVQRGNATILRELYVNNGAMPEPVQSLVSSVLGGTLTSEEAVKLLDTMRDDESLEPPHISLGKTAGIVPATPKA